MPLTLDDWTHGIAHHLRMIKSDAKDIVSHASAMRARPDFYTMAEGELQMAHDVLSGVVAQLGAALKTVKEKPTDG